MSDTPNNPGNGYNPYPQGNPYNQGAPVGGPSKFCAACGTGLVAQAVICPKCGSPTGAPYGQGYKTKTAAVLLAVFLGPWTWLYTYRRNAWKFWIGLASGIVGFVVALIVAGASLGASQAVNCSSFNSCQYTQSSVPALAIFAIVVCYLIPFAVWVWAIVDVAIAPNPFYQNYPNG